MRRYLAARRVRRRIRAIPERTIPDQCEIGFRDEDLTRVGNAERPARRVRASTRRGSTLARKLLSSALLDGAVPGPDGGRVVASLAGVPMVIRDLCTRPAAAMPPADSRAASGSGMSDRGLPSEDTHPGKDFVVHGHCRFAPGWRWRGPSQIESMSWAEATSLRPGTRACFSRAAVRAAVQVAAHERDPS